jgi:hypothetical protein
VFGVLLGRLLVRMWEGLGSPEEFRVMEWAGADEPLREQILEAIPHLSRGLARGLEYRVIGMGDEWSSGPHSASLAGDVSWGDLDARGRAVCRCVLVHGAPDDECVREVGRGLEAGYVVVLGDRLSGEVSGSGGRWRCGGGCDNCKGRLEVRSLCEPVRFGKFVSVGAETHLCGAAEMSQGELLGRLGLSQALIQVGALDLPEEERDRNLRAMLSLGDPRGRGGRRVLVETRHAPNMTLEVPEEQLLPWVPLLPEEGGSSGCAVRGAGQGKGA